MAGAGFAAFFDDEALDAAFVRGVQSGVERVSATGSYVAFDQVQAGVAPMAQVFDVYLDHPPEFACRRAIGRNDGHSQRRANCTSRAAAHAA